MTKPNRLTTVVNTFQKLPESIRTFALSKAMGNVVKYAGTSGLRYEKLTPTECIIVIPNRKKVRNHIGSVHAAAMGLLAETATGFMTGLTVPDNRIIVIKSMQLEYLKQATGDMKAIATFSDDQVEYIKNNDKGDIDVPVVITDEKGVETVKATMIWAWAPKRKS
jgi:acyl-coenzyme A thioesterase PaaI-like protein